jgi:phosphoribosylformylglycinamidine synthase
VQASPSLFLQGMEGSRLPIVVAHGEGRASSPSRSAAALRGGAGLVGLRYVENDACEVAERYPANPNGSPRYHGQCSDADGRVTHHDAASGARGPTLTVFLGASEDWGEDTPWLQLFRNAHTGLN